MKTTIHSFRVFFVPIFLVTVASSLRSQIIEIPPRSDNFTIGFNVASSPITFFGQSFRPPADFTRLDSFTFWMRTANIPPPPYSAYLVKWDESTARAVGPLLFASEGLISPFSNAVTTPFTTLTSGIVLDLSGTYFAFLAFPFPNNTQVEVGEQYNDGSLFHLFARGAPDVATALSLEWDKIGSGADVSGVDLRFRATFATAAIPEPATYGMMGAIALIGGALISRSALSRHLLVEKTTAKGR